MLTLLVHECEATDQEALTLLEKTAQIAGLDFEMVPVSTWESILPQLNEPVLIVVLGNKPAKKVLQRDVASTKEAGNPEELVINGNVKCKVVVQLSPEYIIKMRQYKGGSSEKAIRLWTDVWSTIADMVEGVVHKRPKPTPMTDPRKILQLLTKLKDQHVTYDYETWGDVNALRPELCNEFRIVSIGLAWKEDGEIESAAFLFDRPRPASTILEAAWIYFLENGEGTRTCHNSRYEHKCNIKRFGRTWPSRCTLLRMHAVDELASLGLERVMAYCGVQWGKFKQEFGDTRINPIDAPVEKLLEYNGLDAHGTYHCDDFLTNVLETEGIEEVASMDEDFSMMLAWQEAWGMHVDQKRVSEETEHLTRECVRLEAKLRTHKEVRETEEWATKHIKGYSLFTQSGKPKKNPKEAIFNPSSTPMMRYLLMEKLGLEPSIEKKNGKETVKFDKKVLAKHVDAVPVVRDLNAYRSAKSMLTFLAMWNEFICSKSCVHSSYSQVIVITGRLSSSDPPLQNIPKVHRIRRVFTSRYEGGWMISADYAQQEPRLQAGFSGDKKLIESILAGKNLHAVVGAGLYGVSYESVIANKDGEIYDVGKKMNLGNSYGQTEYGLSKKTGKSVAECKNLLDVYNADFAGMYDWRQTMHEMAFRLGYVEDLFGARRHLAGAQSEDRWERERAFRQAGNAPIQMSGYRFMQIAASTMIRLFWERFKAEYMPGGKPPLLVGQVHDSAVVDTPNKRVDEVLGTIVDAMLVHNEMPYWKDRGMPMAVDIKIGRDLHEMKPVKI